MTVRNIYHVLIAQVQTAQHQTIGVGVIAIMMKRINHARKVIFRFEKNRFQNFKRHIQVSNHWKYFTSLLSILF